MVASDSSDSVFHYTPDLAAAITALVLFVLISLANGAVTVYTRTWFMLIVAATGFLEAGGYISRILVHFNPSYGASIAMQVILVIAPSFFTLANYVTVGRIMRALNVPKILIKSGWVASVFFGLEILALVTQSAGAGLSVSNKSSSNSSSNSSEDNSNQNAGKGQALLMLGLGMQVLFLTVFIFFTVGVNRKTNSIASAENQKRLRLVYVGLYATSILLNIRCIFRLIEFAQGFYGFLSNHEVFLYIFDTIPVFCCVVLYTIFHYGLHSPTPTDFSNPKVVEVVPV